MSESMERNGGIAVHKTWVSRYYKVLVDKSGATTVLPLVGLPPSLKLLCGCGRGRNCTNAGASRDRPVVGMKPGHMAFTTTELPSAFSRRWSSYVKSTLASFETRYLPRRLQRRARCVEYRS